MSWVFKRDPLTDQAENVLLSVQEEIEGKQEEIDALEKEFSQEKEHFNQFILKQIHELESRKLKLSQEIQSIDQQINFKRKIMENDHALEKYVVDQLNQEDDSMATQFEASPFNEGDGSSQTTSQPPQSSDPSPHTTNIAAPESNCKEDTPSPSVVSEEAQVHQPPHLAKTLAAVESEQMETTDEEFEECNPKEGFNSIPTAIESGSPPISGSSQPIQDGSIVAPLAEGKEDVGDLSYSQKEIHRIKEKEPNLAFVIQRSTNSNTVVYASKYSDTGQELHATNPLDVYWIMYEQQGHPREELNLLERNSAYGVSCTPHPSGREGHFKVVLASLKDRPLDFFLDENGLIRALGDVYPSNGQKKQAYLQRVYVESTTSWGIPTVKYVEIFAQDPVTGEELYEKKIHKK